jgi:hypothetical protein
MLDILDIGRTSCQADGSRLPRRSCRGTARRGLHGAGRLLGALASARAHPLAKRWLIDPVDLGKPTLASVTGLAPGFAGLVFGAALVVLALVLPQHPSNIAARAEAQEA